MSKDYCSLKKTRYPKLRNLTWRFSMYGKMQESGLAEITPSALWGQYPVCSHPECPQGSW